MLASPSAASRVLALAAFLLASAGPGCSGGSPSTSDPPAPPTPIPTPVATPPPGGVLVGRHTGLTQLGFVAADPAPGSTVEGCGRDATGCAGRVRMRFRLLSPSGGPVLDAVGFLHATSKVACHSGSSGPFTLRAGEPLEITVVFDRADPACFVPATISDMKLVLVAPVETDALQEWGVRYELRP